MKFEGKYSIEINYVGDGRIFLNRWDYAGGDDVICQLKDGKLLLTDWDDKDEEITTEITLPEFIEKVKQSIIKSEKQ